MQRFLQRNHDIGFDIVPALRRGSALPKPAEGRPTTTPTEECLEKIAEASATELKFDTAVFGFATFVRALRAIVIPSEVDGSRGSYLSVLQRRSHLRSTSRRRWPKFLHAGTRKISDHYWCRHCSTRNNSLERHRHRLSGQTSGRHSCRARQLGFLFPNRHLHHY